MSSTEKEQSIPEDGQRERQSQVKRPMNAFMLWSKEKRRKISSVDPSLHNSHISKILGEEWKRLPMHEKESYIKQSKTLMEKHKKEHPDYHYKPRQNKLTKALKELSSLRSSLATPQACPSRIKSLASMSKLVSHTVHCPPPFNFPRPRPTLNHGRDSDDLHYPHPAAAYYSRPLPCVRCTCCHDYPERYIPNYQYLHESRGGHKDGSVCYEDRSVPMHGVWKVHAAATRYGWSVPFLVDERPEEDDREGMTEEDRSGMHREKPFEEHTKEEDEQSEKSSM